jgi:hypothetical protein
LLFAGRNGGGEPIRGLPRARRYIGIATHPLTGPGHETAERHRAHPFVRIGFTLTSVPLEQYFNDIRFGQGMGFTRKIRDQYYLVTNWHVLSMCDFFTGASLRKDAGRPNVLRTLFNIETGSFARKRWDIRIRDDNDKPLWFVHPNKRGDIAVLPMPFKPQDLTIALYALNVLARLSHTPGRFGEQSPSGLRRL